jgi:hypothetical protein
LVISFVLWANIPSLFHVRSSNPSNINAYLIFQSYGDVNKALLLRYPMYNERKK